MKRHKSTSAEVISRKLKVENWLADGLTRSAILQKAKEENWNTSHDMIDRFIHAVKESWKKMAESDHPYYFQEANITRQRLYLRALQRNDIRTALAIRDSLDQLRGQFVNRNLNMNLNNENEKNFNLSPEEEKRLAKELGIIYNKPKEDPKK